MGLKTFDLAPGQFKDGGIATPSDDVNANTKNAEPKYEEGNVSGEENYSNHGLKMAVRTQPAVNILKCELPINVIEEVNNFIDSDVIPNDENFGKVAGNATVKNSYSGGLVGQINRDKNSAQLDFPLFTTDVGKQFKTVVDKIATSFLANGYNIKDNVLVDTFQGWTVHSYAGDYNPLHDHGCRTPMGLSCIIYLKVPKCIEDMDGELGADALKDARGKVDGFTYFQWGTNTRADINILRHATEEYVKPEVGTMIMFPAWLKHSVMPFYGDGERRTMSCNINCWSRDLNNSMDNPTEFLERNRGSHYVIKKKEAAEIAESQKASDGQVQKVQQKKIK